MEAKPRCSLCKGPRLSFDAAQFRSSITRACRRVHSRKHRCAQPIPDSHGFRWEKLAPVCRARGRVTASTTSIAPEKVEEDASETGFLAYSVEHRAATERTLFEITRPELRPGHDSALDASYEKSMAETAERRGDTEAASAAKEASKVELDEKEKLRRQRISGANKGKKPWNLGRRHSEATKEKISAQTKKAMQRPDVVERLRAQCKPKAHTPETKAKISNSLRAYRRLKSEIIEELVSQETEESLSAAIGAADSSFSTSPGFAAGLDPSAMDPEKLINNATARKLMEHFSLDRIQRILSAAQKLLAQNSDSSGEEEAQIAEAPEDSAASQPQVQLGVSQDGEEPERQAAAQRQKAAEHRAKIADSIRKKWENPEYRAKVMAGNARSVTSSKPRQRRSKVTAEKGEPEEKATRTRRPKAEKMPSTQRKAKPKLKTIVTEVKLAKKGRSQQAVQQALAKKLEVAAQLVSEMEAALAQFPEQDLVDDNPEVQQSVREAHELLSRAKEQVEKLTRGQAALSLDQAAKPQSEKTLGVDAEEVDRAMLILNMD